MKLMIDFWIVEVLSMLLKIYETVRKLSICKRNMWGVKQGFQCRFCLYQMKLKQQVKVQMEEPAIIVPHLVITVCSFAEPTSS